jgi:hypothetical protein
MLDQEFCMWNSHFLPNKPNKPIFDKNLDVFFSTYPYTHVGNKFFVDNMPYKNMFNGQYNAIFLSPFMAIVQRIIIYWGLFSLI